MALNFGKIRVAILGDCSAIRRWPAVHFSCRLGIAVVEDSGQSRDLFAGGKTNSAKSSSEPAQDRDEDIPDARGGHPQLTQDPSPCPRQYHLFRYSLAAISISDAAVKCPRNPKTIIKRKRVAFRQLRNRGDAAPFASRTLREDS
jgi:hypothetical protein